MSYKVLRPLKRSFKFQEFAVVDCETWGLGGKLAFGVVYFGNKDWEKFKTKKEFYKILEKRKVKIIYAHNMEFDCIKIRNKSVLEGTKNPVYAGGLLISVECEKGIKWRDSYALLKSKLDDLGTVLGKNKGYTPEKFINPPKKEYRTISLKDIKYCVRDCEIAFEMLMKVFRLTNCQKLTIASTCMHYFRNKYLKEGIKIKEEHKKFRDSYFGGRVEAFKLGKVDAKVIDVNSLYPYVMQKVNLPHPAFLKTVKESYKTSILIIKKFEGVAKVKVEHPQQKIGMLPLKMEGKLCFPVGVFEGSYNFNELRFFMGNGGIIKKVYELTYSPQILENPFKDYVKDLYELKNTTKGAEKLIYKFLLNTLYGKFGENKHEKREYFEAKEISKIVKKYEGKLYKIVELKRGYFYIDVNAEHSKEPIHQCFTFCSYITSEARLVLLKSLLKNSKKVVYCDTDSMAIEGRVTTEISNKLGGWSYEDYNITKVYGNKFYMTEKGLKLKGVPKSSKLKGKTFYFTSLVKSKESLRRNLKAGSVENRTKLISFDYNKRFVKNETRAKKGETSPLRLFKDVG